VKSIHPLKIDNAQSEIIDCEYYTVNMRTDDIIQMQIKDGFYCELEDAKKLLNYVLQLSGVKIYPLLVIYPEIKSYTKEASDFIAKHTHTLADGLIGTSSTFFMLGNFYLVFNKPMRPTKLFRDVEPALKWLKQFLPPKPREE